MPEHGKCLLVSTHHRPLIGGALTVYDALARYSEGQIEILTASHDYVTGKEISGWQSFDKTAGYQIHRMQALRINGGVSLKKQPLRWLKLQLEAYRNREKVLKKVKSLLLTGQYTSLCVGDLGFLGWLTAYKQELNNVKVVLFIHGEEVSQAAHSRRAESDRVAALKLADKIISVSQFTSGILQEKYAISEDKIVVSSNGVDLNVFSGDVDEKVCKRLNFPKTPIVFSCGRLVERKGFDKLIESWPIVLEKVPDATLLIGGVGDFSKWLITRTQELGVEQSVKFIGCVPDTELASIYGLSDVFVMPNRTMKNGDTEGFGLVFLEAAAMGTPSIAGRAGGAVEAVIDGETGLLVDSKSPLDIANNIIKILENKDLRKGLGRKALVYAKRQGWDKKVHTFLSTVNEK